MREVSGCGLYIGPRRQYRLNKTDYGSAVSHSLKARGTDTQYAAPGQPRDQQRSEHAQGKGIMRPELAGSLLRIVRCAGMGERKVNEQNGYWQWQKCKQHARDQSKKAWRQGAGEQA